MKFLQVRVFIYRGEVGEEEVGGGTDLAAVGGVNLIHQLVVEA